MHAWCMAASHARPPTKYHRPPSQSAGQPFSRRRRSSDVTSRSVAGLHAARTTRHVRLLTLRAVRVFSCHGNLLYWPSAAVYEGASDHCLQPGTRRARRGSDARTDSRRALSTACAVMRTRDCHGTCRHHVQSSSSCGLELQLVIHIHGPGVSRHFIII